MVDQIGNEIPAPGVYTGTHVEQDEILYSYTGRFTQKGVTLKAGEGVLVAGTVLARETSTKKFVKYASGGSGGTNVAVGILRKTVDTGTDAAGKSYLGNIIISGILKLVKISSANAGGDSAVLSAFTGSRKSDVLGTFTF